MDAMSAEHHAVTLNRRDTSGAALVTCHPSHVPRIKAAYASGWQLESETDTDAGQVVLAFRKRVGP